MSALDPQELARLQSQLRDRNWRLRNLYYITDDDGNVVKFRPNHAQQTLENGLHTRNIVLKSRQHGITTWACIRALDTALFRSNTACGIVADTKENAEKFFRNKVLYAYDRLPQFLKAEPKFALTRKDMNGEIVFGNGSSIVVGTSLRSGTYQRVHVSELGPMVAKYPQRAIETISGTLNAVPTDAIVTIESTAEGAFGAFFTMCQRAMKTDRLVRAGEATLTAMDYKFFFLAWYEDATNVLHESVFIPPALREYFDKVQAETGVVIRPEQQAWYAKKLEEQDESMWSQFPSTPAEAFKASVQGSYYGKMLDRAEIDGRVCTLPFLPGIPVNTFWDIGRNDTTAIWFHQEVNGWHHFIDFFEHSGEGAAYYALELQKRQASCGYVYGTHYLPHDTEVTDWSQGDNKSRAEILEGLGVKPLKVVPRIQSLTEGIEMTRQVIPKCRFDKDKCGELKPGSGTGGLPALRGYRKEWSDRGQCWSGQPVHDWASNGADAFRQFAQGYKSTGRPGAPDPKSSSDRSRQSASTPRWRVA